MEDHEMDFKEEIKRLQYYGKLDRPKRKRGEIDADTPPEFIEEIERLKRCFPLKF